MNRAISQIILIFLFVASTFSYGQIIQPLGLEVTQTNGSPPDGHLGGGGHDFGPFDPLKIPMETQVWWTPNFGHTHGLIRAPLRKTISGTVNFDVRCVLHNNPSTINLVRICPFKGGGGCDQTSVNFTCPYGGPGTPDAICAFNTTIEMDTATQLDGWREFRVTCNADTVDGKRMFNSGGFGVFFDNGNAVNNYRESNLGLIGRGWYTTNGYTNAWIEEVPTEKVSGTIVFGVRVHEASTHLTVELDKTHFIPAVGSWPEVQADPGVVLFDEDGDFDSFFDLPPLDTTQLANGWHSIAARSVGPLRGTSECSYCAGENNRVHGISKAWFYVDN